MNIELAQNRLLKIVNKQESNFAILGLPEKHIIAFESIPTFSYYLRSTGSPADDKFCFIKEDTHILLLDIAVKDDVNKNYAWVKILHDEKIFFISSLFLEEI
jgi:hypothetical protein